MVRCALTPTVHCGCHEVVMDAVLMRGVVRSVVTVVSVRARPCEGDTLTRHDVLLCFLFPCTPLSPFSSLQGVK